MAEQVPTPVSAREADARVAIDIRAFQAEGRLDAARERYSEVVTRYQRRAARIAYHYLRDAADADEAVQDAFIKAYMHIGTFREDLPFEVWFTRILINGCLDRIKARRRRERWMAPPVLDPSGSERDPADYIPSRGPSPEELVLSEERRQQLMGAVAELPERQRMVFMLSHFDGRSSREVSAMTGLNESTVRVHLFRAIRRLRGLLVTRKTKGQSARRNDRANR
ncbi:MAG: sigma-70 family RNA polymerase sigma factor [Acidobacteria bacterium]|jgi:RNA polymerase sigma-70 factor (ECF subfamily)|nr:sigma-70 family RNA polymerase sigma factor [Acidobacteriota bacterium]